MKPWVVVTTDMDIVLNKVDKNRSLIFVEGVMFGSTVKVKAAWRVYDIHKNELFRCGRKIEVKNDVKTHITKGLR